MDITENIKHHLDNIRLHPDAIIVEKIKEELKTKSGLILNNITKDTPYCKVVKTGKNSNPLYNLIIRPKFNMGESINIEGKEFIYFPYWENCYYYIKNKSHE